MACTSHLIQNVESIGHRSVCTNINHTAAAGSVDPRRYLTWYYPKPKPCKYCRTTYECGVPTRPKPSPIDSPIDRTDEPEPNRSACMSAVCSIQDTLPARLVYRLSYISGFLSACSLEGCGGSYLTLSKAELTSPHLVSYQTYPVYRFSSSRRSKIKANGKVKQAMVYYRCSVGGTSVQKSIPAFCLGPIIRVLSIICFVL